MPQGQEFAELVQNNIAKTYDVTEKQVANTFSLTPSKEQRLNKDVTDKSGFLRLVNVEQRGQKTGTTLTIGRQGPGTQTNNTKSGTERRVNKRKEMTENPYQMHKSHTDFSLHDDDVSDWSEFSNWKSLYRSAFADTINDDRQMIGFHGKEHVKTSDLSTKSLMQDVNIGWIELLKKRNPTNVMTEGKTTDIITIGEGGDYANLDEYVSDIYQGIPMHKRGRGMTAVIGQGLLAAAEGRYWNQQGETPTEKRLVNSQAILGTYGGLPAITADFFPENGIMITNLKRGGNSRANLTLHSQRKSWKRFVQYKPEIESTVDWNARWEGYHIDDLKKIVMALPKKVIIKATGFEIEAIPEHNWAD